MLGFQLFLHSLRMILGNLAAAIRITIPILVFFAVLTAASLILVGSPTATMQWASDMEAGRMVAPPAGFWVLFPFALIGGVITFLWVATAWHRFILLEEVPGAMGPRFNGAAIGRYFAAGFVLGLLIFVVAFAMMFIGGIVGGIVASMGLGAWGFGIVMGLIAFIPILIAFYRLSPILPSAAVGPRITVGEAWSATSGSNGAMLMLALISFLASYAITWPLGLLAATAAPVAIVFQVIVQWITTMYGISIMTTIYGHFVEKRDLNA